MPEYRVKWEMDIEADTPEQAARKARDYQLDPDAIVGVFHVRERLGRYSTVSDTVRVDLDTLDGRFDEDEDEDDETLSSTHEDQIEHASDERDERDDREGHTKGFAWKSKEVVTIGDLVSALANLRNAAEAQAFMREYRTTDEHADANIGYCIGIVGGSDAQSAARRAELHEWLGVQHPLFEARY